MSRTGPNNRLLIPVLVGTAAFTAYFAWWRNRGVVAAPSRQVANAAVPTQADYPDLPKDYDRHAPVYDARQHVSGGSGDFKR